MNKDFGADFRIEDDEMLEADAAIYGERGDGEGTAYHRRVVAVPIPLGEIKPDLTQPRRAIPPGIREEWMGDSTQVPALLSHWHGVAEVELGEAIDLVKVLRGQTEGLNIEDGPAVLLEYLDLLALAESIHRDGLVNPITIAKTGLVSGSYIIETGERRWLAYHLLMMYVDDGRYRKIPAVKQSKRDVWRQAAENSVRRPLNAIGMARQLALLIMDMYAGDDGVAFDSYDEMIFPGEADRRFYAQVADGNIYRVKRGMGQRVLDVTGMKSKNQISQYRALLNIPDEIWVLADLEGWTENRIREHQQEANRPPESSYTLTGVNLSPENAGDSYGEETEDFPSPNPSPLHGEGNDFGLEADLRHVDEQGYGQRFSPITPASDPGGAEKDYVEPEKDPEPEYIPIDLHEIEIPASDPGYEPILDQYPRVKQYIGLLLMMDFATEDVSLVVESLQQLTVSSRSRFIMGNTRPRYDSLITHYLVVLMSAHEELMTEIDNFLDDLRG